MRARVLVVVLVAIAASCDADTSKFKLQKPLGFNVPLENGQLLDVLERLKTWLQDGYTKPSIPVMDPFKNTDLVLNINNPFLRLIGILNNAVSTGLSDYTVKQGEFNNQQAVVSLRWEVVDLLAMYEITSSQLPGSSMMFGMGAMVLIARGLEVTLNMRIGQNSGNNVYVSDVDTDISLDSLEFNASGLMGDETRSEELSKYISDNFPQMLVDNKDDVSYFTSRYVESALNNILGDMSYQDFIDLIQ